MAVSPPNLMGEFSSNPPNPQNTHVSADDIPCDFQSHAPKAFQASVGDADTYAYSVKNVGTVRPYDPDSNDYLNYVENWRRKWDRTVVPKEQGLPARRPASVKFACPLWKGNWLEWGTQVIPIGCGRLTCWYCSQGKYARWTMGAMRSWKERHGERDVWLLTLTFQARRTPAYSWRKGYQLQESDIEKPQDFFSRMAGRIPALASPINYASMTPVSWARHWKKENRIQPGIVSCARLAWTPQQWRKYITGCINEFFEAYRRQYQKSLSAFRVIELTKQGWPHLHLPIPVQEAGVNDFLKWAKATWTEITGDSYNGVDVATRTRRFRNRTFAGRQAIKYVAKYAQKHYKGKKGYLTPRVVCKGDELAITHDNWGNGWRRWSKTNDILSWTVGDIDSYTTRNGEVLNKILWRNLYGRLYYYYRKGLSNQGILLKLGLGHIEQMLDLSTVKSTVRKIARFFRDYNIDLERIDPHANIIRVCQLADGSIWREE